MKEIRLKASREKSIMRLHPWIFSGGIKEKEDHLEEGDLVRVVANKGRFLALGHYGKGSIAVRILSFKEVEIDASFWHQKIQQAVDLRRQLGMFDQEHTSIFRLVHAEGDELPGLIVDFYNGIAVMQCHSVGMFRESETIAEALKSVMGDDLKAVYRKSEALGAEEGSDGFLLGSADKTVAKEHGISYHIDFVGGQKTGFFIDQREHRKRLMEYSKGKKVLNTFCYSGGFSLAAIKGGAELVHSVDSSAKAIELLEENLILNGMEKAPHQSFTQDAVDMMKELEYVYDIIVLDPPAFAKHKDARHKAIQGYKRLNAHAMRQIKPGGIIFTFSCSQVVDKYLFNNTITAAAISAEKKVRILEQLHQPQDHPFQSFHPEGEYLKGLILQVY